MKLEKKCSNCSNHKSYSNTYDAYYCLECDIWLEPQCSDESCAYCQGRIGAPSEVLKKKCTMEYNISFYNTNGKEQFLLEFFNATYKALGIVLEKHHFSNNTYTATFETDLETLEHMEEFVNNNYEESGIEVVAYYLGKK